MLIKLESGIPTGDAIGNSNFRSLFPAVSFPAYLTPDAVEPFGYGMYEFSQTPEPPKYHKVTEGTPVKDKAGIYRQKWDIVEMSPEEKLEADAEQEKIVRDERNFRLLMSDWTQLADSPVDGSLWLAYRQELRDVSLQQGFPWDVEWPLEPEI